MIWGSGLCGKPCRSRELNKETILTQSWFHACTSRDVDGTPCRILAPLPPPPSFPHSPCIRYRPVTDSSSGFSACDREVLRMRSCPAWGAFSCCESWEHDSQPLSKDEVSPALSLSALALPPPSVALPCAAAFSFILGFWPWRWRRRRISPPSRWDEDDIVVFGFVVVWVPPLLPGSAGAVSHAVVVLLALPWVLLNSSDKASSSLLQRSGRTTPACMKEPSPAGAKTFREPYPGSN